MLSNFQRLLLRGLASTEVIRDPARADLVSILSEMTSNRAVDRVYQRMLGSASGRVLLAEQRRVSHVTLEIAQHCQDGTFGKAYADFMDKRHFKPDDRSKLGTSLKGPHDYVLIRLREIHDFLHVVLNCPTTIEGEVALKAVEFANCQLPVSGLATLAGRIQVSEPSRRRLQEYLLPWALRAGGVCSSIESIDFESKFELPLDEVRNLYNFNSLEHTL